MSEERIQAYLQLIEQLLGCAQGEEAELLEANAELVDAGLVTVMGQYARHLKSQGDNDADWIWGFATQLAQALDLDLETTVAEFSEAEVAVQFLRETLGLVARSNGNPQQVYPVWAQQQAKLNTELLAVMPYVIQNLFIARVEKQAFWADVVLEFGNLILQFPLGIRWLNLEISIAAYEQVMQVRAREVFPEKWATTQNNLSVAYLDRIRGNRAENLEQAIYACEKALQIRTREGFPELWGETQNNLANAYFFRIQGDQAENLEQAISAYRKALRVKNREAFPEDWATLQNNLASAYFKRIRGDRANNLERAIIAYRKALQVRTQKDDPKNWAMTQTNLAVIYSKRIRGNRVENIEQAINACLQALRVSTRETFPEDWAATQNNLALAYSERIQGNRSDNIEQAIKAYEQALEVYTRDMFPEDWAMVQNNLATTYSKRIQGDRSDNIEREISLYLQALHIRTREAFPNEWAATQSNLASAYSDRIRGNRAENLEQSILTHLESLQVRTRESFPEDWATTQNHLATAYSERIRGNRSENIEQAIDRYLQALQVRTREKFPDDWAMIQNNLAITYLDRIQNDRATNLEQAITTYTEALSVYTPTNSPLQWATTQNNLAAAYFRRIQGDREHNLELAILACNQALQVRTRDMLPKGCCQTSRILGNIHLSQGNWQLAQDAYENALAAAEALYQSCILLDGKVAEIAETAEIPCRLAYALARTVNLPKAIATIEQGRARGLSESLDRDRANLDQLKKQNEVLYTQYKQITQQLRNLEAQQRARMVSSDRHSITPEALRNEATHLREELTTTIDQIRRQPGYETFLTLPTFEDVQKAVTPDSALTYLIATPTGSVALVVTPGDIHSIWLNDFTDNHLTELLQTWFAAYDKSSSDRQTWHDTIDTTTQQLWAPLIGPLAKKLQDLEIKRITLIPTGYLSLLPLHAAWTPDDTKPTGRRYALDDIHITYAPNAKSLTAAQAIVQSLNARGQADTILAIDEPHHRILDSTTGQYNPVSPLPSSSKEVESAIATFQTSRILQHNQATREAVLDALPHTTILHCSCHGNANLQEPLKSGLAMTGDGEAATLTLKDLLALKLTEGNRPGLRLAILSACETGMIGLKNADEAISLAPGLLNAGVAGVVASLWSVSEQSTMLLLLKFYELWRGENPIPPDQALRKAQQWLRDSTEREIAPLLGQRTRTPDHRPFAHPYYWSAFSYTGL